MARSFWEKSKYGEGYKYYHHKAKHECLVYKLERHGEGKARGNNNIGEMGYILHYEEDKDRETSLL